TDLLAQVCFFAPDICKKSDGVISPVSATSTQAKHSGPMRGRLKQRLLQLKDVI
ncbi:TPA_asm: hypothetical protein G3V05_004082, partial [Salmonella enterica subsp. enterica serovar Typhimurium]|nr:hypothetical protein [Salmonella enterica subsp. enterica]EEJ3312788.1 hypothetical protein [Salmonella enterica subsp. enterica]HAE1836474.1 hypothetical protein [Salmonella enterica subsp. enterica serovar Typhimurium]HAF0227677.1 hypothetical protein [Salmonella enterica subsp. enterica serovar Typhimurium]